MSKVIPQSVFESKLNEKRRKETHEYERDFGYMQIKFVWGEGTPYLPEGIDINKYPNVKGEVDNPTCTDYITSVISISGIPMFIEMSGVHRDALPEDADLEQMFKETTQNEDYYERVQTLVNEFFSGPEGA